MRRTPEGPSTFVPTAASRSALMLFLIATAIALASRDAAWTAAAGRPPDLQMSFDGEVRLRFRRGIAAFEHEIYLHVDRTSNGIGWDEVYFLGRLQGTNPVIDTGVRVAAGDKLDLQVDVVDFVGGDLSLRYSSDRDTRPGEPGPRVVDHDEAGGNHFCGGGPEGPLLVTDLVITADRLHSLTCWEDAADFDYNDFAVALDYTPDTVPTATSTPTAPPTSSATPTRTAPPTVTPTRTSSPPGPVYLPLVLGEDCPPRDLFVDVVLVLDTSTTMRERDPAGRRKIDLASGAIRAFLRALRLHPGEDRAALITFDVAAEVRAHLTHDLAALESALDAIVIQEFTRIDLGLRVAIEALPATPRPNARPAVVLLSDGIANPVGDAEVRHAAADLKQTGARVYVVGLGPHMNELLLRAIASEGETYVRAEEADALEAAFGELALRVPCPPETYWSGR